MADGSTSTELARLEPVQRAPVRVTTDAIAIFDTARFEHMQRVANLLASTPLLPAHLKGKTQQETMANCFLVVNRAANWHMDPTAVAETSYVVHGKLGHEGKVVHAALQRMTGIRLRHKFEGREGTPERKITLWDPADPERSINGIVGVVGGTGPKKGWRTKNEQWDTQPDDQLIYRGTRQWCRRYEPGVILGVYTPDELEAGEASEVRDITLPKPPRIPPKPAAKADPTPAAAPEPADAPYTPEQADRYLTHLEEELIVAAQNGAFDEAWDAHMEGSHARLDAAHQAKADALHAKHKPATQKE